MNTLENVIEFGRVRNFPMESYTRLVTLMWNLLTHFDSVSGFAADCKTAERMDAISDWIEAEHITDWNKIAFRIETEYNKTPLRVQ